MHKRLLFVPLLLLIMPCCILRAQDDKIIDSLINTIPSSKKDSNRINEIIQLANKYYLNNHTIAKKLTDIALNESIAFNYQLGIADSYNLHGIIYSNRGIYDSALIEFSNARVIYTKKNNHSGIVNCYNNTALIYSDLGRYSDAIINYIQALKTIESFNDESLTVLININLGKFYIEMNVLEEAENFLNSALEVSQKYNLTSYLEYIYSMKGLIAFNNNDFTRAHELYLLCFDECKKNNNRLMLSECNLSLGLIYEKKEDFIQAEKYFNIGLEIAEEIKVPCQKVKILNEYSYLYYITNSLKNAKAYATKAYNLSQEIGYKEGLRISSLHLSYINYSLGNFQQAYDQLTYSDSILNNISDNKIVFAISDLLTKIENDRKEYSNQINLQKKKIRNLALLIVVFVLIVLIIGIVLVYRRKVHESKMKENILNRELTSKVMFLAKRNEVFSKIETTLSENKDRFIPENQPLIQNVLNEIQSAQDQHIWKEFEYYFTSVHKDFYNKIYAQFPNLTVNERRLCALLRLNLTTKDISSITHQSMHSIDIARARLRKKLGLSNTKVSIYSFLFNF